MSVDPIKIKNMLLTSAQTILDHIPELTRLDCDLGDGDHGTTMEKIAKTIQSQVNSWDEKTDVKEGLESLNDVLEDVSGGSAAPLVGSYFCGMAEAADNTEDTDSFIKRILLGGYDEFYDMSGAEVGGKTMMDAIYPAIQIIRSSDTLSAQVLESAAAAAKAGSDATADMLAKFGRGRYIGERALGHIDPGSVTFALFFEGLAKGYQI
ncbi:DAK2 domain-containing protein [Eubacterium barkeri]|uniref:phosphoenolpyruvate--glycerone phosphotransferase n=1 Tax=Eubacterium barkeri TaxID=1528 RepID=A0A1H3D214_EUBBA|nr:DAK2 domain-containing protein [Eubacterium barkeri]SDX60386.1 dihydroxyacetone kinase, C-terminal domain [Eubacterium barkeri]